MSGIYLRQSTASQSRALGPFLDDTDFKTAETALTIANTDIKLMANGAASANKNSGGGTHRTNGFYGATFDATDTATVGELAVSIVVAGALPVFHKFFVLEEAVYDALFGAASPGYVANAPVNVAQFGGSNGAFASGRPEVNTTHFAGTSQTARDIGASVLLSPGTGAGQLSIASGIVNANAVQISGDATAADVLENELDETPGPVPTRGIVDQGTAQSASSTGLVLRSAAAFADDTLIGMTLSVLGSTQGHWQSRVITDNALSGDTVTVDAWTVTPSGTIIYKIYGTPPASTSAPAPANLVQVAGSTTGVAALATNVTAAKGVTDKIDTAVEADGGVYRFTVNALEQSPSGTGASAASIATAVWDEALAGHTTAGSAGKAISDTLSGLTALIATIGASAAGVASAVWSAATRVLTAGTNIVLAKGTGVTGFNDLSAAQVNAEADTALSDVGVTTTVTGRIDAAISSRGTGTALDAAGVRGAIGLGSANADTQLAAIKTDTAAVKAKTDTLPASPAGAGDVPSPATIAAAVQTSAAASPFPSNVKQINGAGVAGNGTSGNKWRPA